MTARIGGCLCGHSGYRVIAGPTSARGWWGRNRLRTALRWVTTACLPLALALGGTAMAQTRAPVSMADTLRPVPAAALDAVIKPFVRLKFPAQSQPLTPGSDLQNQIFKPDTGAGPFPAIVLVPSCAGSSSRPEIRLRTQEFLAAGYLVLVLENYAPRGQRNCRNQVVTGALIWRDVVDALAHLHTLDEVDKAHIYQVGYSAGAMAAAALSSRAINQYFDTPHRFSASVGWYGGCAFQPGPRGRVSYLLRADMEHPVLMLMSEDDREVPARPYCFPLLDELKAAGKPVDWHLYQGATHAWDVASGYVLDDNGWGERVENRYSAEVTADATRRTLAFLLQHR